MFEPGEVKPTRPLKKAGTANGAGAPKNIKRPNPSSSDVSRDAWWIAQRNGRVEDPLTCSWMTADRTYRANRQQNDNNQQLLADECGPANDLHASPARRLANVVAEGHGFLASSSVSSQRTRCPRCTSASVASSTGRTAHWCPSHSRPGAPRTLFLLLFLMIVIAPRILITTNERSQNWSTSCQAQPFDCSCAKLSAYDLA